MDDWSNTIIATSVFIILAVIFYIAWRMEE